jgi:hypothetical protein
MTVFLNDLHVPDKNIVRSPVTMLWYQAAPRLEPWQPRRKAHRVEAFNAMLFENIEITTLY